MKLSLTQQQINELNDLRACAGLLAIQVDLLKDEYEKAQERERNVYQAAINAKEFYYDYDRSKRCGGGRKGERITDGAQAYLMNSEQFETEFIPLIQAKYAELYNLHYPINYSPIYEKYHKPLIEAQREFREIGVKYLRICGQNELANELEKALNSYISPTIAEKLDNITRQFAGE